MSSLTLPTFSKPMDSFEDLVQSDAHHFIIQNNTLIHSTLKESQDPLFKAIWAKVQKQGLEKSIFHRYNYSMILQNKEMVLSTDMSFLRLRVRLEYSSRTGESVLYVGKEGIYPSGLGIPMRKNAPYAGAINKW